LNGAGLDVVGGTTLFRLTRTDAASALFRHLGRAGILTRAFTDQATWLRFGLPASEPDWRRLQIAMAEFRGSR
jgi:cobalamin biosynthetic protein CobC